MFYETWSTISKDLIISRSLPTPAVMVSFCHCLEFCISFQTILESFVYFGGHFWDIVEILLEEGANPFPLPFQDFFPPSLKKNTMSDITYKNHGRFFPYFWIILGHQLSRPLTLHTSAFLCNFNFKLFQLLDRSDWCYHVCCTCVTRPLFGFSIPLYLTSHK